jgi:hypothetical protein
VIGLAFDIFGSPALVAAIASLAIATLGQRFGSQRAEPFIPPVAIAIGYFLGYLALPRGWAALWPQAGRSWQWLPYLGLAAAAVGFITAAAGNRRQLLRHLTVGGLALAAAWLLTPHVPIVGLARPAIIFLLTCYLLLVAAPLQALPSRLLGHALLGLLAISAGVLAVLVGAEISFRLAQLAAIAAAALAGCLAARFFGLSSTEPSVRSVIPMFGVLAGGLAFIACVEPEQPLLPLLLVPAAPLGLWLMIVGRLASLSGKAEFAIQAAVVIVPLAVAVVWAVVAY